MLASLRSSHCRLARRAAELQSRCARAERRAADAATLVQQSNDRTQQARGETGRLAERVAVLEAELVQAQVQASSAAKAASAQGASGVAGSSPDSGGSTGLDREEFAKQLDELKQQVFSESERANAALKELELEQETGHKLRERYGKVCA